VPGAAAAGGAGFPARTLGHALRREARRRFGAHERSLAICVGVGLGLGAEAAPDWLRHSAPATRSCAIASGTLTVSSGTRVWGVRAPLEDWHCVTHVELGC